MTPASITSFSSVGLNAVLILGVGLTVIGMAGLLLRKNIVIMLMSLEMMLLGGVVGLIGAARYHSPGIGVADGALMAPFILIIAAGEVCIGLSLVMQIYKMQKTFWVDEIDGCEEVPLNTQGDK